MSLKTQAKVLRVLQEGEVERLGSAKTVNVDVRVIAATNKNLEAEIEKGNFREDLYFRLAVIPIYVPPLRERPEDIPLLVKHFPQSAGPREQPPAQADHAGGDGRPQALSMARQHPRAAQHDRAAHHHDRGRHDRRARSARVAASRTKARRGPRPHAGPGSRRRLRARARKRARCASSRSRPSARGSSKSCARMRGTSRRPPKSSARPGATSTRSSSSTRSGRRPTGSVVSGRQVDSRVDRVSQSGQTIACRKARGKSELRRAVRRVTPGQGNLKD